MSQFNIEFPDDIFKQLKNINNFDEVAPEMIKEALPILQESIKKELANHKQSGELINSATTSTVKPTKTNAFIGNIVFKGTDSQGIRNGLKAAELEYGNSRQSATPFLSRASKNCEKEVEKAMQDKFNILAGVTDG